MDRRDTLRWMLAAAAAPVWRTAGAAVATPRAGKGLGTDPDLMATYERGKLWPLTFTPAQSRCAAALCGVIIPADERSPGADQLGVHEFIDEWISAPYPDQQHDRKQVLEGLAWIDAEATHRFDRAFAALSTEQQQAICDDICWIDKAGHRFAKPAQFFALFRDLTAGGFYTTPEGTKDLRFAGNVASENFDGPPAAVLKIVGVS
jgi:hypothetical protein